jgi:hypothetical protein
MVQDSPLVWEVPISLSGWRPRLEERYAAPTRNITLEDIEMKLERAADRRMVRDAAEGCLEGPARRFAGTAAGTPHVGMIDPTLRWAAVAPGPAGLVRAARAASALPFPARPAAARQTP